MGGTTTTSNFTIPPATEIELYRTFSDHGVEYTVTLTAYNMHNEDDQAVLTWKVLCAQEVKPAIWELTHESYMYENTLFNATLTMDPNPEDANTFSCQTSR